MSDAACRFDASVRYCLSPYLATQVPGPEPTGDPVAPMRDGTLKNCTDYHTAAFPDTCQKILDANGISIAQFFAWYETLFVAATPSLSVAGKELHPLTNVPGTRMSRRTARACGLVGAFFFTAFPMGLIGTARSRHDAQGYQYCVRTTPFGTDPTPTGVVSAPGPTQTGQPSDCIKWYIAKCTSPLRLLFPSPLPLARTTSSAHQPATPAPPSKTTPSSPPPTSSPGTPPSDPPAPASGSTTPTASAPAPTTRRARRRRPCRRTRRRLPPRAPRSRPRRPRRRTVLSVRVASTRRRRARAITARRSRRGMGSVRRVCMRGIRCWVRRGRIAIRSFGRDIGIAWVCSRRTARHSMCMCVDRPNLSVECSVLTTSPLILSPALSPPRVARIGHSLTLR